MAATFVRTNDLVTGVLAASAAGRALMASSFFESSTTVNAKFDAAVIQSSRLDLSTSFNFTGTLQKNGVDVATTTDVSVASAGLDPKESVRAGTLSGEDVTSLGTGGAYAAGQFTWTAGPVTLDGVTLANSDRILVKNQTDAKQNGIYVRTDANTWDRASDHDGSPANEVSSGNHTFIEQGTVNAGSGWVLLGDGILTLDTDTLDWTAFSGASSVTGGAGIAQTGSTLFIQQTGTTLTIGTDNLDVNLATNGGLEDSTGVKIKLDTNPGLQLGAGGISILTADASLVLGGSGINVQFHATGALETVAANGVRVRADATTIQINGSNNLEIIDNGVTYAKLASAVQSRLGGFDRRSNFTGDGATTDFELAVTDANGGVASGGLLVTNNGIVRLQGATEDYQFGDGTGTAGVDEIQFNTAPENGSNISVFHQRTGSAG